MASRMLAKDTVYAALAECYVTVGDDCYNFMQAVNLEAKIEKKKIEVPILGQTGKGNKAAGWKGTGKATFYYNTSIFRRMLKEYKDTGKDIYFDIQISNDDPDSEAGRQTVTLKQCNLDGGIIAKFDIGSETLEEELDFTFEDFEMPEEFTNLDGMVV